MKLRKIGNSNEIGSREKEEFRGVGICTDAEQPMMSGSVLLQKTELEK